MMVIVTATITIVSPDPQLRGVSRPPRQEFVEKVRSLQETQERRALPVGFLRFFLRPRDQGLGFRGLGFGF